MENIESEPNPPPPSSIPSTPEIPPSSPNPNPNPNPNPQTPNLPLHSTPSEPQPQPQPQPHLHQSQQTQQQQQQQTSFQQSQQRLPVLPPLSNKARQPYSHFSQHLPSPSPSPSSPIPATPMQRTAGLAIGFPAHSNRSTQPHSSFGPSSFGHHLQQPPQQLSGMPRNSMIGPSQVPANVNEQLPNSNTQVRQSISGIHGLGMTGSFSATQIRPSQPSRSQSPSNNQALAPQKFQGHGMLRSNLGSTSSSSPVTPQGPQPPQQPWLSAQGKPMHQTVPSPSYRQHPRPQNMPQRQQHSQPHQHPLPGASHQQQMPSSQQQHQQQPSQLHLSQEQHSHQYPLPRMPQTASNQPQVSRAPVSSNPKAPTQTTVQPSAQSGSLTSVGSANATESGNQILSKRSIHELVAQIDPSERLNPEVEDILVEIADDFVESITTFACSLAKHRKSTTLEAKDILLHLERNWHMTLPGFSGDDIKSYKKPDSSRSLPRNKKLSL